MGKKILCSLLTALVLLSCVPMGASAAEVTVKEVVPCQYDTVHRFSGGLARVERDGKYGFIDKTGKEVIPCKYNWVTEHYFDGFLDDFVQVYVGEYPDTKWGFVDKTGKEIVPCKYEGAHPFSDGLAAVYLNGKFGFVDTTGQEVIPLQYESAENFYNGLAAVKLDGKRGYIDKTGKKVIPCEFDDARSFYDEGLAAVKLDGKWGYIDKTGKEVVPCKYDSANSFSGGLARVERDGKYGYIDETGKEVVLCKYDDWHYFYEGFASMKANGKWGFVDKTGKEVIPCKYDDAAPFSEGLAKVKLDGKCGFIDKTGKEIIPCKYDSANSFSGGLAEVRLDGKYGFIDKTGNEVAPCKYDGADYFFDDLAAVRLDDKWGFIDKTGREVIPCKYDEDYYTVQSPCFSEGLANVGVFDNNGDIKRGFIDKTGKEVVPCKYDYADSFSEGLAGVCLDGKWGFISVEYGDSQPENPEKPTVAGFQDVTQDDYYASAVVWAVNNRITAGTSDSTFSPNDTCSRAQIVAFLWRATGRPEPTNTSISFTDVQPGSYYEKAVQWAVENRITAGTSDTTFSPNDTCTRGQIVSFLWRAHGRLNPTNTSTSFRDVEAGAYYEKAVQWAVENRVTAGTTDTTFSPNDTCVRAQGVAFLWRAAGRPE